MWPSWCACARRSPEGHSARPLPQVFDGCIPRSPGLFFSQYPQVGINRVHRITARLLLLVLLVGVFAPAALAAIVPAHACCVRKPMMHSHSAPPSSEFHATDCSSHRCCRPLTSSHSRSLRPLPAGLAALVSLRTGYQTGPSQATGRERGSLSARAPPQLRYS
jgi:hypothetical protein